MRYESSLAVVICLALFGLAWTLSFVLLPSALPAVSFIFIVVLFFAVRLPYFFQPETPDGFFLHERKMPKNQFVGTFVTSNIGLFSSIAFSTILAYYYGIAGMVYTVVAWFVGIIWFSSYLDKFLPYFRSGATLHQFIGAIYSKTPKGARSIALASSIITFILYFASVGVEIKFLSDVIGPILPFAHYEVALLIAVSGLTYSMISGYRGVTYTDRIQFWFMIFCVIAIFAVCGSFLMNTNWSFPDNFFSVKSLLVSPDPGTLVSTVALLALYQFCVMDMWQRCTAVVDTPNNSGDPSTDQETVREIKRMLVRKSVLPFLAMFCAWFLIGFSALVLGWTDDPNAVLPAFLDQMTGELGEDVFASICFTIILLGFLAAGLSTVDTFLVAAAQTVLYDWLPFAGKPVPDDCAAGSKESKRFMLVARVTIFLVGAMGMGLAFMSFGIMAFWVGMYSLMLAFFPPIFLFVWKGTEAAERKSVSQVSAAILLGATASLAASVYGTFFSGGTVFVSIAPILAVLISSVVLLPDLSKITNGNTSNKDLSAE